MEPRRNQVNMWTDAEKAIMAAVDAVEAVGADVRLTDAVCLLLAAKDSVADYVDEVDDITRRFWYPKPEAAPEGLPHCDEDEHAFTGGSTVCLCRKRIRFINTHEEKSPSHAQHQAHADGFQAGWHAALRRLEEGDGLDTLRDIVPDTYSRYLTNALDRIAALEAASLAPEGGTTTERVEGKFGPLGNLQGDDHPWRK